MQPTQPTPPRLWKSPLGKPSFIGFVLFLLLLTILKLISSVTFIDRELALEPNNPIHYDLFDLLLYGIWLIGPPVVFLVEYTYIFGEDDSRRMNEKEVADLKYCHELAGKIWAGVSVFLGIVLLIRYGIKL